MKTIFVIAGNFAQFNDYIHTNVGIGINVFSGEATVLVPYQLQPKVTYKYLNREEQLMGVHPPPIHKRIANKLRNEDDGEIEIIKIGEWWKNPIMQSEFGTLRVELLEREISKIC